MVAGARTQQAVKEEAGGNPRSRTQYAVVRRRQTGMAETVRGVVAGRSRQIQNVLRRVAGKC